MVTLSDIQSRKDQILEVAARHGASRVRVFGSVSRGDASPSSDVDLLVHLNDEATLLDQIALKNDLEDLLGCNVDVVDDDAVFPAIRDDIMAEAVTLWSEIGLTFCTSSTPSTASADTLDMPMGSQSYQSKPSIRSRLQGILTFERILPCPSW